MSYKIEYKHNRKDFEDVWNIEMEYFTPKTVARVEQVMKWDNKNSDIHIFIRHIEADRIIAEITILPFSEDQFNKFISNELEDTDINEESLMKFNSNSYLLFSAIAIDSEYREDKRVLSLLLEGFDQKLKYLLKNGVKFLNMCAEGQTIEGQKFIESFLNLKHQNTTKEGYKLYAFNDTEEFNKWLNKFPNYINNYNKNNNL